MSKAASTTLNSDSWRLCAGAGRSADGLLTTPPGPFDDTLCSPRFIADPHTVLYATFTLELISGGVYVCAVRKGRRAYLAARAATNSGATATVTLRLHPSRRGWHQFILGNFRIGGGPSQFRLLGFALEVRSHQPAQLVTDTCLSHWGIFRRWVHHRCQSSRAFNTIVSAIEMRLGREEVLSLPQFMAICPTGVCNALCTFCSVTQNRGGITKQELKADDLARITGPAIRSVRSFGLEGNGEPTLHKHFDAIVDQLGREGADLYLITNGERLTPALIDRMLADGVKTVNISLNAATAATHQAVMKLKSWDQIIANLRCLIGSRPRNWPPRISVSMVVTAVNIHETADFIRFAEQDLGVDAVHVRPLSELGDDLGAVEDVRAIVPYEGDVADMLDAVAEYLSDHPRRSEIHFIPANFRSIRSDPADRLLMPSGFEGRLLPPRRDAWTMAPNTKAVWSSAHLAVTVSAAGEAARSGLIFGDGLHPPLLRFRYCLAGNRMSLLVLDGNNHELQRHPLPVCTDLTEVAIHLPPSGEYRLVVEANGSATADFDFERLRTPCRGPSRDFRLPPPDRWRTESFNAQTTWQASSLRVVASGAPGPYLIKSYATPTRQGRRIAIPVDIGVASGTLGIGVLEQGDQKWIATWRFPVGNHHDSLQFASGSNFSLSIVLYSVSEAPLDAEVNWGPVSDQPDPDAPADYDHPPAEPNPTPLPAPIAERLGADSAIETKSVPTTILPVSHPRQIRPFYCQKPWTDLNTFTVDGRADVCCIATGPSQERFSLGNLMKQDFQSVWNGERMREFRRTVNSSDKLPPCQRCPMAQAWEGPLFSRSRTLIGLRGWLERRLRWGFLRRPIYRALAWLTDHMLFRGFPR